MMRRCFPRLAAAATPTAEYDAIVVGAGSAGCLIAGRLAMDNIRTLVIEEGADIRQKKEWYWTLPASQIAHRVAQRGYENVENVTVPQQWPDGTTAAVNIPTPKVLGGHGVMGTRTWNVGDERDWEGTAWNFREEMLPTLRSLENMETFAPHRGKKGKFLICRPCAFSQLYKPFCEAVSIDVPLFSEFTKKDFRIACGCGRPDTFSDQPSGKAHSTLQRYVLDVLKLNRPLTVQCDAKVVGVRAAANKATAAGVTYRRPDGQLVDANASMIIVSAGAVGTPKLLAASRGSVDVDAAVGQGFWDVPQVVLQYKVKGEKSHNCYLDPMVRAIIRMDLNYATPLLSTRSSWDDMVLYWSSKGELTNPDVQIIFQPFTLNNDGAQPLPGQHGVQFLVRPLRPKSRGKILADGTIDPAYFTAPEDLECVKKAVAYIRDSLAKRASLVPVLGEFVQSRNESSGMCGGGASAVVDPKTFRVKGLANVYACDSSVFPKPTAGTLLPYTLMMADQFADTLLRKKDVRRKAEADPESNKTRIVY